MKTGYYDMDGNPIDVLKWGELFENFEGRIIGRNRIGLYDISTVWIGLDHNFSSDEIHIFESMIFCDDEKDELCEWQERYSTKQQALEGHKRLVEMCDNSFKERLIDKDTSNGN